MSRCISCCSLLAAERSDRQEAAALATMRTGRIADDVIIPIASCYWPAEKWARRFRCQQALVRFRAGRSLLAVADGLQPVGRNAKLHQEIPCRRGAPVAETQVVLSRTALVAMPFHVDGRAGEIGENALQRVGVGGEGGAGVVADVVRIVIEERILQIGLDARFERARRGAGIAVTGAEAAAGRSQLPSRSLSCCRPGLSRSACKWWYRSGSRGGCRSPPLCRIHDRSKRRSRPSPTSAPRPTGRVRSTKARPRNRPRWGFRTGGSGGGSTRGRRWRRRNRHFLPAGGDENADSKQDG